MMMIRTYPMMLRSSITLNSQPVGSLYNMMFHLFIPLQPALAEIGGKSSLVLHSLKVYNQSGIDRRRNTAKQCAKRSVFNIHI